MSTPTFYLDITMTRHEPTYYPKPKVPDRYILQSLVITIPLSEEALAKLRNHFPTVFYHPDGDVSSKDGKALREGEVWFTGTGAFPRIVKSIEDVPKARVVQLASGELVHSGLLRSLSMSELGSR
jgi:hypothetical protein